MKLVLFDIDGTLMHSNGVARRAYLDALQEHLGRTMDADDHDFAGRTDRQIFLELTARCGIDSADAIHSIDHFFLRFRDLLASRLREDDITVHRGVPVLLERLGSMGDALLGLLTGNTEPTARLKLERAHLAQHFAFGAFGHESHQRSDLPALAIDRASRIAGCTFTGSSVVILGDTPNDIHCGRHLGVRSIAVATGSVSHAELARHAPDFLFHDFSETDHVIQAVMG